MQTVKIISTGEYVPSKKIYSTAFDVKFKLEEGACEKKSGVIYRSYASGETLAQMAAKATDNALSKVSFSINDIDCIISSGGAMQQPIPCTAAIIQKELGLTGRPCLDINTTCLSFVTAFDMASYLISAKKYKHILIVSADIASQGLDYDDVNSAILFGDAAAAVIVGASESSGVISSKMKTFSDGCYLAEIKGGMTALHPLKFNDNNKKDFLFKMNGTKLYELAVREIEPIVQEVLDDASLTMSDIKLVIPHQASIISMKLMQKRLKLSSEKFLYIIQNYGNTIASSIPLGINHAIDNNLIQRGDKVMLLGTSAGVSIGALIYEY